MKSSKDWEKVVGRVYDNVEAALWAMLLAFVIYFITLHSTKDARG